MLRYVRHTVFNFCGGYTVTSFYNDSVRLSREAPAKSRAVWWGRSAPPTTPSTDVRQLVMDNETATAAVLVLLVCAGGLSAMTGGLCSFVLEGPDGPVRYVQAKQEMKRLFEN